MTAPHTLNHPVGAPLRPRAAAGAAALRIARRAALLVLPAALAALGGCAGMGQVQPWEKGNLARPAMTFDYDRLEKAFGEHTYFSKEAASGGAGVGGGGCGCN